MRFVRLIAGILLLTIGLPMLFIGGALWTVLQQRSPNGAFGGPLDRVDTPGHAVVVPDLDALLRQEAPFLRTSRTGMRIIARTGSDPAFIGLAPAAEVSQYLSTTSYAQIDRVSVTRGQLPLHVSPAESPGRDGAVGVPGEQGLWIRHGVGVLDLTPDDVRGHRLSLVVMRPDARPGLDTRLRVEVRPGWLSPAAWSLLTVGGILVLLGIVLLARPVRPREVVFVVEPDQVPAFAARLGIAALNDMGNSADRPRRTIRDNAVAHPRTALSDAPPTAWPLPAETSGSTRVPSSLRPLSAEPLPSPRPLSAEPPSSPRPVSSTGWLSSTRPATLADVLTPSRGGPPDAGPDTEPGDRTVWPLLNSSAGSSSGSSAGRSLNSSGRSSSRSTSSSSLNSSAGSSLNSSAGSSLNRSAGFSVTSSVNPSINPLAGPAVGHTPAV
ncbi:hypothetical protein I0C86_00305, partial [Plantactinospora sp. S1510]